MVMYVLYFYLKESDKLKDEDLFRLLSFMRKPAADISRKFKIIPGHLKMDIQPPFEGMQCCLTSNLFEVSLFLFVHSFMYHCLSIVGGPISR